MKEQVLKVLDEIRPSLRAHGGDVEFVDVTPDGWVQLRLIGHCASCPMAELTLSKGIQKALKEKLPQLKGVKAV